MPELMSHTSPAPMAHRRPPVISFDSGEECSVEHWMQVCKLVDDAELPAEGNGIEISDELQQTLADTLLEVEPSTAYQDFARHII